MSLIFIYQATFKCPLASCDCHLFAHHVKGAPVSFLFSIFINGPLDEVNKVIYSIVGALQLTSRLRDPLHVPLIFPTSLLSLSLLNRHSKLLAVWSLPKVLSL